jgi:(p)ppGpp synthase/HD superfamily hydrolase
MSTLEKAIAIAATAHAGAVDKAGAPYILHPLRVMLAMSSDDERIVAVLHDVVEDTDWTFESLAAEGFSPTVIQGLRAVTKRPEDEDKPDDSVEAKRERYLRFVARAAADPIGRKVKLADLLDNSDLTRISQPTDKDRLRLERYRAAIEVLRAQP